MRVSGWCAAAAALVLAVPACSSGDQSDGPEAWAYVPSGVESITLHNIQQTEERLGIEPEALDDGYIEKTRSTPWLASSLTVYASIIDRATAGWNPVDVDWELSYTDGGMPVRVLKLDDSVDWDQLTRHLTDIGYQSSTVGDLTTYELSLDRATRLPSGQASLAVQMMTVTPMPDDDILVVGPIAPVRRALEGETTALPEVSADAEYVMWQSPVDCSSLFGRPLEPDQLEHTREQMGAEGLGHPTAETFTITADESELSGSATLEFPSEEQATADARARTRFLKTGTDLVSARPNSELYDVADVSTDGATETVTLEPSQDYTMVLNALQQRSFSPWLCLPG